MKRIYLTGLLVALAAQALMAQGRDVARMKSAAREALAGRQVAVERLGEVRELRTLDHLSVVGYDEGGFAVVSADGRQVLGVSTARSSAGRNPNFEWWLAATNEALARQESADGPRRVPSYGDEDLRPNPKKYPLSVAPMLQTHWGQQDPYNRLCPYDTLKQERTAVGCVATSMAQVLNYYKTPEHGVGQRTAYYPYQDETGQSVTVDFSDVTFRWDLLNVSNFKTEPFTDEQAEAISTLLIHMSVAADMRFGCEDVNGSATTAAAAVEGFQNYLLQPDAQVVYRDSYDDEEWLDMVYSEISTGHPVIYGGQAFSGGHSFILHGYDRNGLFYVNWGWNGDDEGYYSINLLNPGGTAFSERQDMIIGLNPTVYTPQDAKVQLTAAGQLAEQLDATTLTERCSLSISGQMNEADFSTLRQAVIKHRIGVLDLSQAQIETLPERALYGCAELTTLHLPAGLTHIGDGALGDLRFLQTLELTPADDADFVVDGNVVYSSDRSELICVLTTAEGELTVPATVTTIHPYAFSGCVLLTRIELPASVTTLSNETFRDCYWLETLKVRSKSVIELSGYDIFEGIDKQVCTLYVPSGLKTTYSRRAQWKDFLSIEEFGTTVKAQNAVRKQGEPNPEFGYSISGDAVTGTPHLYTDATQDSPAGVYTIFVEPGTITALDVDYVNGRLIIEENTQGINNVQQTATGARRFDLQGRQQGFGIRGLFIERQPDGQVRKQVVRKP
ncbi:MAG: C10 family peptidase [Prevotella sp.]|nr:C10 family peptidase [Prevotella sp.]